MNFPRIFWTLFFPVLVAWSFSMQLEYERTANRLGVVLEKHPGRVTTVYMSPLIMPIMLLAIALTYLVVLGFEQGTKYLLALMSEAILILSIYYVILLCCLPLLRRCFSARACATLWLIPVFLYWLPYMWRNYPIKPRVVLKLPPDLAKILALVWLTGFIAVIGWKITSHLLFRRQVLTNALPVTESEILVLWEREQKLIERKKPIPLLCSEHIVSPMTIGKSDKAICTLLPRRRYTLPELQMIFRHELRHIQRLDVDTKMFYAFCEAVCWFNPLVWIAMGKAAADLELSCDEMVLYGKDARERRQYAELLLDSAGDDRGFTTCLSASAKTLRYRLKNVMQERRRLSGTLLIGIILALLLCCSGMVVVSQTYGTMEDVVFARCEELELQQVWWDEPGYNNDREVFAWDTEALMAALGELRVAKVLDGVKSFEFSPGKQIYLAFYGLRFDLSEEWLWIYGSSVRELRGIYRVESSIDWDVLSEALDSTAPDPDPDLGPVRPHLEYYINHGEGADKPLTAVDRLLKRANDSGVWVHDTPLTDWDHAGGLHDFHLSEGTTVQLAFSYEPVWYTVEVTGRNCKESYTVKGEDLPDGIMELAPYSANYRIKAYFESYRDTTYDMEFYFVIERSGEE